MTHLVRTSSAAVAVLAAIGLSAAALRAADPRVPTTTPTATAAAVPAATGEVGPGVPAFTVRPGYKVTLAADHLGEARFIEFGDGDVVYMSQPSRGKIIRLADPDASGKYTSATTFVTAKKSVHGMQWYKGKLWFTQSGSVHVATPAADPKAPAAVTDVDCGDLPEGGGHWYRSILVDDDGFYTSIGDDGNANEHVHDDRCRVWHYNLDGSGKRLFCTGIRNTEKLRYRPGTKEVWGCDHGSDNFGGEKYGQPVTDLNPPDEFNHYVQDGFYGHPYVVGNRLARPEYAGRPDIAELCAKTIPPAWSNGAHWANNGWTFTSTPSVTGQAGDAVVCFHGSWNSSLKVGYCVQRIEFDPMTGQPCGTMPLVKLLSPTGDVLGRPVDCGVAPDGSLLFSDDQGRKVYRLTRK